MMIDPKSYIEDKQNWSLEKLYKEKEYLEKYIYDYNNEKLEEDNYFKNPSPDVIASVYEDYLVELVSLITKKENEKNNKKVYRELTDYRKISDFVKEYQYNSDTTLYKIFNKNGNVEIMILDEEMETTFFFDNVCLFNMEFFTSKEFVYNMSINRINDKIEFIVNDCCIYIKADSVRIKYLDLESIIYTYASVKYKEEQKRTFYYISNINNLKVGDYVKVPARDTSCIGIVDNIEKFSYKKVPFPVNRTKKIIRKSSKEEFDKQNDVKPSIFKRTYEDDDKFKFKEKDTLLDRAMKLPFVKTQKVEWKSIKKNEDGTFSMPFPDYNDEVYDWIEAFYKLELIDYNYIENYNEGIKDKKIDELYFEEILSYMTYFIRGERFCDGLIASNLENGKIEELEKKLFVRYINFIEIDYDNINNINENEIMFFTLAEGGAMGEPCGIEIITMKNGMIKLYHINYGSSINIEKLYSKFSTLKTLQCGVFGVVRGVQKGFIHVDTGMGNHLFVNDKVIEKFRGKIANKKSGIIYANWIIYALDVLKYDWNKIHDYIKM